MALAVGVPAQAQAPQPVELHGTVMVEKTVTVDGKESRVLSEPKVVVPGDKLLFTTAWRNTGVEPIKDFVVTNPLPSAVMLAPEGNGPLVVSVDGGKTWGQLAQLNVPDGNGATRPAQAGDVTHVRWTLAVLEPGGTGELAYHAIVR